MKEFLFKKVQSSERYAASKAERGRGSTLGDTALSHSEGSLEPVGPAAGKLASSEHPLG